MVVVIQNGKVVGCERNGHSFVNCENCAVEDAEECYILNQPIKQVEPKDSDSSISENARRIGTLVEKKQIQYGDSFGNADRILRVLYPYGVAVDQYKNLLAIVRIIDKLFRVANGDQGEESAWDDIVGYGLLAASKKHK